MSEATTIQYTLRQVPQALDDALRRKAAQEGKSLNQTAIEVLQTGLALAGPPIEHRDLDFMRGTWVEDPAFDEAIQDQHRIDSDLWR